MTSCRYASRSGSCRRSARSRRRWSAPSRWWPSASSGRLRARSSSLVLVLPKWCRLTVFAAGCPLRGGSPRSRGLRRELRGNEIERLADRRGGLAQPVDLRRKAFVGDRPVVAGLEERMDLRDVAEAIVLVDEHTVFVLHRVEAERGVDHTGDMNDPRLGGKVRPAAGQRMMKRVVHDPEHGARVERIDGLDEFLLRAQRRAREPQRLDKGDKPRVLEHRPDLLQRDAQVGVAFAVAGLGAVVARNEADGFGAGRSGDGDEIADLTGDRPRPADEGIDLAQAYESHALRWRGARQGRRARARKERATRRPEPDLSLQQLVGGDRC